MEKYRPDRIQDVAQQAVLNCCTCDEALRSTEVYVPRFGRGHIGTVYTGRVYSFFLKSILYDSAILLFSNAPDFVEEEVVAALQHSLQTGLQHRRFDRYSLFCQHRCPVTQALDKPKTSPADFYCQVSCPI